MYWLSLHTEQHCPLLAEDGHRSRLSVVFCVLLLLVNVLEDVLEAAIVGFQDGVLGAHVQRPLLLDGVLEAAVSESPDRLHDKKRKSKSLHFSPLIKTGHAARSYLVRVVHSHPTAP